MAILKLNRPVGRSASAASKDDIRLIQLCLAEVKISGKPLWDPRKIDGKDSSALIAAIEAFQSKEKLTVNGKIAANDPCWNRLHSKVQPATREKIKKIMTMPVSGTTTSADAMHKAANALAVKATEEARRIRREAPIPNQAADSLAKFITTSCCP